MEITEVATYIASLPHTKLIKAVEGWIAPEADANRPDFKGWLSELSTKMELSPDEVKALRVVLYCLAARKEHDAFPVICKFFQSPVAVANLKHDDWSIANLNCILGLIINEDDTEALSKIVFARNLSKDIRKQALNAIHYGWLEQTLPRETVCELYRKFIGTIIASHQPNADESIAMQLALNSAVICGAAMRTEIANLLDAGIIKGENNEKVANAIQSIISNDSDYTYWYPNEHKCSFATPAKDLHNINKPVQKQDIEMQHKGTPIVRANAKIGRNDPCPCGSGKKYKKCCGRNL